MSSRKLSTIDELLTLLGDDTSEEALVTRRFLELTRTAPRKKARRLVFAEQQEALIYRGSFKISEATRELFNNDWPERERRLDVDRMMLDALTKKLKAQGVRAYRGEAKKLLADLQGVTVNGLKQRWRRRRRSKA